MTKNNDRFDAVLASVPLNSTAAKVTARGEHWKPERPLPPGLLHWDAPPPMKTWLDPTGFDVDLTGRKIGRLTVLGILDAPGGKNRGGRWVVRCACGDYEVRTPRALKMALAMNADPKMPGLRCYYCMSWLATSKSYKKKGGRPLSDFVEAKERVVAMEVKSPEAIMAEEIENLLGAEAGSYEAAVKMIARLNSAGYRIVRETIAPCSS